MNVVMVPFHDVKKWQTEGYRTRDAHVCQHLDSLRSVDKILVINRPVSLAERVLRKGNWTADGTVVASRHGARISRIFGNTYCLDIHLSDFLKVARQRKAWWFTAFQYSKVHELINWAINTLDMESNILLVQNPMAVRAVPEIEHTHFAFDAIDNWLYHPQMLDKDIIRSNYHFVDTNSDLILTVSQALLELFPTNLNAHCIPNGVDVQYFAAARKTSTKNSEKTENVIQIGYVGKIQDRVDFDLVEQCLRSYPRARFVFIGPVFSQQKRIKELKAQYSNIEFTGDVHYNQLPERLHDIDIAIIPHRVDSFTQSMNPLKLYEYLAAGKLVVSTGVAGVSGVSPYVSIGHSNEEFIRQLGVAMETISSKGAPNPESIASSIPETCTWDARVKDIMRLFAALDR